VSTECPTCGRDGFKSRQGMKVHHAASHGVKFPHGEPFECGNCGDIVYKHVSRVERTSTGQVFCDSSCQYEWMSKNLTGEDHPQWVAVEQSCPVCGDDFYPPPSKADKIVTCSNECKAVRMSSDWDQVNPEFARYVGRSGEDNPSWSGGYDGYSYGAGWDEGRRKSKQRDGHCCVRCGSDGPVLDSHHIVPFDEFDDPLKANDPNNLVTLCRECHMVVDGRAPA